MSLPELNSLSDAFYSSKELPEENLLMNNKKPLSDAFYSSKGYIYGADSSLTRQDHKNNISVSIIHIEDRKKENTYFQVILIIEWKKFKHKTKFHYSWKGWYFDTILTNYEDSKEHRENLDKFVLKRIYNEVQANDFSNFKRVRG